MPAFVSDLAPPPNPAPVKLMNLLTRLKLSCMMFLEFFIWGAWLVTLGTFLGRTLNAGGLDTANVFSTQSWGAIIAPFIVGIIGQSLF